MPSLKDKGVALLGSLSGVSVATAATTTIFTTPIGKTTRLAFVIFRDPSASAAAATSVAITSFRTGFSLVNLTSTTGYVTMLAADGALYADIAAGTAVQLSVTTGAAGVTCTVEIFGYLT